MLAAKCLAVAGCFPACRDRLAEQKMLASEIGRLLSLRHLPLLCQAATECVASLAQDSVLQLQLLQAGALWHLVILLFEYDFTLDDGCVQHSEATNKQQVFYSILSIYLFVWFCFFNYYYLFDYLFVCFYFNVLMFNSINYLIIF